MLRLHESVYLSKVLRHSLIDFVHQHFVISSIQNLSMSC